MILKVRIFVCLMFIMEVLTISIYHKNNTKRCLDADDMDAFGCHDIDKLFR